MSKGSGEAIRGKSSVEVDSATGDRESAQRQQHIAACGVDEFEHGHYHGNDTSFPSYLSFLLMNWNVQPLNKMDLPNQMNPLLEQ